MRCAAIRKSLSSAGASCCRNKGTAAANKKAAAENRGGFVVCGGQLHKQNGRHLWRPYSESDHRVEEISVFGRPGSDLLSRVLRRTTIGAEEFNGRVRDGIGYRLLAETTRPAKDRDQKSVISNQKNTDQKLPEASWAIRNGFQRSDY